MCVAAASTVAERRLETSCAAFILGQFTSDGRCVQSCTCPLASNSPFIRRSRSRRRRQLRVVRVVQRTRRASACALPLTSGAAVVVVLADQSGRPILIAIQQLMEARANVCATQLREKQNRGDIIF